MKFFGTITGQSNETGPGYGAATVVNRTAGPGGPLVEPIGPVGGYNSWWPRLASLMGKRGHWLQIANTARGGTSMCDVWVGRCTTYANGANVVVGSYRLSGNAIWKATGFSTGVVIQPTTAPTGTSDIVLDGITWVYLGVPTSRDTNGRVYEESDVGRFDPNGFLADCLARQQAAVGYDVKLHFVSIGQGDKTVGASLSEYKQGMISISDYFTKRGIYVLLGMTCYGATSGLDQWYTDHLLPGREAALAASGGNPLVKRGANLRNDLGVLAVEPTAGAGLQSDFLHLTPAYMDKAADAWDAQLQSLGW